MSTIAIICVKEGIVFAADSMRVVMNDDKTVKSSEYVDKLYNSDRCAIITCGKTLKKMRKAIKYSLDQSSSDTHELYDTLISELTRVDYRLKTTFMIGGYEKVGIFGFKKVPRIMVIKSDNLEFTIDKDKFDECCFFVNGYKSGLTKEDLNPDVHNMTLPEAIAHAKQVVDHVKEYHGTKMERNKRKVGGPTDVYVIPKNGKGYWYQHDDDYYYDKYNKY